MKKILVSALACFMLLLMCTGLTVPAFAEGTAPVAENMELKTYRNTSVSGTLSAYDPEGDVASFEISTKPVKGSIVTEANGNFVYTPDEGKKGRDYFGYKAIDSEGNVSQEATVIIRIEKQKKPVQYNDMEKRAGEYAAVTLCDRGVFTGEMICGEYCFNPDRAMERGEFLSMCMKLSGEEWLDMAYYSEDNEQPLSVTEASNILNRVLELNDVDYIKLSGPGDGEHMQACMNLSAVGILDSPQPEDEVLTREKAAMMLVAAMEIIDKR